MKKIKITVIRKVSHMDLSAQYENPLEHACDMQEGKSYVSIDAQKPEGLCESAWQSMQPFVMTLAHGGENFYDGWMKNPKSAMISCNDGFRPVSFYVETIEESENILETERLILRPWTDRDAEALFRYASDPQVGPIAGWPPHTSVDNSLEIIRTVFAAPEVYAIVLKKTNEPIGSCGLMMNSGVHSADMKGSEAEIGYWIGVPHWGNGYTPEAVRALMKHGFEQLDATALWIGYYDGNKQSHRVAEKCGFKFHHTEKDKISPLGDIRTEQFARITKEEYYLLMPKGTPPRSVPLDI